MKGIIINWAEDNEEVKSFQTYSNYLLSLKQHIETQYGKGPAIYKKLKLACEEVPSFSKIQINKTANIEKIKKLLFNSWHTEIVFTLPRKINEDLVKYSNHWAPIQAYYSVYLSLCALFQSMGINCPNTHTNILKQISECIINRNIFPSPWNAHYRGLAELNNQVYGNFKEECKDISNLSVPREEDFWNWCGLLLKTTRDRKFNSRKKEMLKSKMFKKADNKPRKNLSGEHKKQIDEGLYTTTLFDGLYRLRIRSNYEDADAFILGTMSQRDALLFHDSLGTILQSTLYIVEKLSLKYISKEKFKNISDDFIKNIKTDLVKETIGLRNNYY
jgi:hypothetical protein